MLARLLARGVAALRFDFLTVENSYTGYAEFDAFGVAAVPEPSTYAMLGMAAAGLAWVRRRKAQTRVAQAG